jgi:hypothetical protein
LDLTAEVISLAVMTVSIVVLAHRVHHVAWQVTHGVNEPEPDGMRGSASGMPTPEWKPARARLGGAGKLNRQRRITSSG